MNVEIGEAVIPFTRHRTLQNQLSPEKKQWVREESAKILSKNLFIRDRTRESIEYEKVERLQKKQDHRESLKEKWTSKTKRSPFAVNLVAESEKTTEEIEIRIKETEEKRKQTIVRREKAKNDLILNALSEFSDLVALRQEKRAILDEEQRLTALLAILKTTKNNKGKGDRIIAQKALKQRQVAKNDDRRKLYRDSLDSVLEEESLALMQKHGLSTDSTSKPSFGGFEMK